MKLATSLNGVTYRFKSITDVLAKANEPKAGDRLTEIAATTSTERLAAKVVLSELTVEDLTENPTIPYESDEVTRVNIDGLNRPGYERMKGFTIGELREWVLDHKTSPDILKRSGRCFTGEVAAAVAKIMTSMDLVYGASKYNYVTQCNTEVGHRGTISYRAQTNSTTDDPELIVAGLAEAVSFGCGDVCLGINPVNDSAANTKRIADAVHDFMERNEIPTQVVVLSHITTQMEAVRQGAPLSMIFQSIAGTQDTNDDFGVTKDLLLQADDLIRSEGQCQGANLLYFETGQGSEVSVGRDHGVDQMTLEARTYGFGRYFRPFIVNNVSGFIGPETLYDGKEMIRASLEDHFMGKFLGLQMGMAPCWTSHTGITMDDQQQATMLLALAGATYYMGVPFADDVMLAYMDTSFHDDATLRELLGRTAAPEFHRWMVSRELCDERGVLTERAGDGSRFLK